MAFSLNRAQILGNVTRDLELRSTPAGHSVTSFGVATNRRFKNREGELQEEVQFHEVVAWGKLAEIVTQILRKGSKVYVEGRLQTRTWEAQDGTKRKSTEIVMDNFVPLTPKGTPLGELAEETTVDKVTPEEKEEAKPAEAVSTQSKDKESKIVKPKSPTTPKEIPETPSDKVMDKEEINLDDIPF